MTIGRVSWSAVDEARARLWWIVMRNVRVKPKVLVGVGADDAFVEAYVSARDGLGRIRKKRGWGG